MKAPKRSRVLRSVLAAMVILFNGLLTLVAGIALVSSVANSRYDDQQNRAPELQIAVAVAAALCAAALLLLTLIRLRRPRTRWRAVVLLPLSLLTSFLIVAWWIVVVSAGPL